MKHKPVPLDSVSLLDVFWDNRSKPTPMVTKAPNLKTQVKQSYDVGFICADYKYGLFLDTFLHNRKPTILTNFDVESAQNQLESLERSKIIVALVSPKLVHSAKEIDKFHVALARHRVGNGRTILYPIHLMTLPRWPTYFHLVPCRIALEDFCWKAMMSTKQKQVVNKVSHGAYQAEQALLEIGEYISSDLVVALSAAGDDIIALLQNDM